tara:strand:- start:785 stop:1291 length:507 start_codon:yes stop_codon:yes gene_type:complete
MRNGNRMKEKRFKVSSAYHEEIITHDMVEKIDILSIKKNEYHVLQDHASHKIIIESNKISPKVFKVSVNGNSYSINIKDEYDLLLEEMGLDVSIDQKVTDIAAPMPGLILEIIVKEGDDVTKGDPILILEAMKMENVIKATGDGKVQKVISKKGDAVEKGQVIIEMEK